MATVNFPRRVSIAVGMNRADGELIALGVSERPSELLPLLDQVDPAEISVAGIIKDVQFHEGTRRTYAEPEKD